MAQITGRQIAAARALLGVGQAELASQSSISVPTLKRMESSEGAAAGLANNIAAVRRALETAGVIFVEENGEGPGVRLRKERRVDDHPTSTGPATDAVEAMDAAIEDHERKRKK